MYSHTQLCFTALQRNVLESCLKGHSLTLNCLVHLMYLMYEFSTRGIFDITINPNLYIFCISFHKVLCTFILYFLNFFLPSSFPLFFPSLFLPSSLPFFLPLPSYIIIDLLPISLPLI